MTVQQVRPTACDQILTHLRGATECSRQSNIHVKYTYLHYRKHTTFSTNKTSQSVTSFVHHFNLDWNIGWIAMNSDINGSSRLAWSSDFTSSTTDKSNFSLIHWNLSISTRLTGITFVKIIMVPRGWITLRLVTHRFYFLHHNEIEICALEWNVLTTTG